MGADRRNAFKCLFHQEKGTLKSAQKVSMYSENARWKCERLFPVWLMKRLPGAFLRLAPYSEHVLAGKY
jgi:hypothetical protein